MFTEADLLPLSALQHLAFCERQWGLIHLEAVWDENRLTVEGRHLHERADEPASENRRDLRIVRGLRIRSLRLGLAGRADVVEFHRSAESGEPPGTITLEGAAGRWRPFPVEYKRGRPKTGSWDEVQLCAQALCLEEMLGVAIAAGALFYGQPRRRFEVDLTPELRTKTEALAARVHGLFDARITPTARYEKKCANCSLLLHCLPKALGRPGSIGRYLDRALTDDEPAQLQGGPP